MNDDQYPSGPWTGFYNYTPKEKFRMDLRIDFANGQMTGEGNDNVGAFQIRGRYDAATRECSWTKVYPGSHEVYYEGYRDGKGIWGRWEINAFNHGGFYIWPRKNEESDGQNISETAKQPNTVTAPQPLEPAMR
jgi:hypothetical protein